MRPYQLVRLCFIMIAAPLLYYGRHHPHSDWWIAMLFLIAAFVTVHVLGASYIRWNFYLLSVSHGLRGTKCLALTFDDGPAQYTAAILDALKKAGVEAAFFTIGIRAEAAPAVVRQWHEEGHIIGNHSYAHGFHFDWKRPAGMRHEIEQAANAIQLIIGKKPRLFRPPYGVTNPSLAKAVEKTGVKSIGWSLRSFDTKAKNGEALLARLSARVQGGDIILLHDSMEVTASILTAFIRDCRQKGFTFVRLDKMLGFDAYA